jgi:transcriptional regulator with GAF, ATPase, and Fis domain
LEKNEVLGRSWFRRILPPGIREAMWKAFVAREVPPYQRSPIVTHSGEERTIDWSNVELRDAEDQFVGTLGVGADVTERIRAENELQSAFEEVRMLKERLEDENLVLARDVAHAGGFREIVGESPALNYVLRRVEQVAPMETTVLLEGETGVGKELFARAIHERSSRKNRPMQTLDCASLSSSLLEAELFGHEKGAYTGADRARKGRFELADGGTLFLDEVGELPLEMQPKLLRVLQDGEFERLGSEQTSAVDVRIIAATNRDLKKEVGQGRFRGDLYFRLSTFPISIPPLRDRRSDLPLLASTFVETYSRNNGKHITKISKEMMQKLLAYDWPGNVRELQNVIERAVITARGDSLKLAEPLKDPGWTSSQESNEVLTLEEVQRRHILRTLNDCSWRIAGEAGAAARLGVHPNTLRSRMQKLGISKKGPPA